MVNQLSQLQSRDSRKANMRPPVPASPVSTASTASILDDGTVVPSKKRKRSISITSTASTTSLLLDQQSSPIGPRPEESVSVVPVESFNNMIRNDSTVDKKDNQMSDLGVTRDGSKRESPVQKQFPAQHGRNCAYQLDETPEEFVHRLQPSTLNDAATVNFPWIWMHNPNFDRSSLPPPDIAGLITVGGNVLECFLRTKIAIKNGTDEARVKSIKFRREREELPRRIQDVARTYNVVSGKWMLFPSDQEVDEVWLQIVRACAAGKLGFTAKVATSSKNGRLICVYTENFADVEDIKRVVHGLKDLGLAGGSKKPIYYKADAWTYLGIEGKNGYGIPNSLYCSKDLLD